MAKNVAWPLPDGLNRQVPCLRGSFGSFAEDRGDRRHCGIDLYGNPGSKVVSIEDAVVFEVGTFTSRQMIHYWNETFYVVVKNESGSFAKYAELARVDVRPGDRLSAGQPLGRVGSVLNPKKIGDDAPAYIRSLKEGGRPSMLHLELYESRPGKIPWRKLVWSRKASGPSGPHRMAHHHLGEIEPLRDRAVN